MESKLMTMPEIGEYLFGERSGKNRTRALNILRAHNINIIKDGKQYFAMRQHVEKILEPK